MMFAMDGRLRCAYCGQMIGVYEPVRVVFADGSDRRGSLLMLRAEAARERSVVGLRGPARAGCCSSG